MPLRMVILALLLLFSVSCVRTMNIIDKQDIYRVTKGTQLGSNTVDRDGYFLSDRYMLEVMKIKIGSK